MLEPLLPALAADLADEQHPSKPMPTPEELLALRKLQEERATLTRFDNELKELEEVIKGKKQAISDAELQLKKLEHDLQALGKDKVTAANFVANLEKMHEWIAEENQYVLFTYPVCWRL